MDSKLNDITEYLGELKDQSDLIKSKERRLLSDLREMQSQIIAARDKALKLIENYFSSLQK